MPKKPALKHILIVDDDVRIRSLYKLLFEQEGFRVSEAFDGENGEVLAEVLKADVVLLDLDMPILNGFEVLKQLRANPNTKTMPVFILSHDADPQGIEKARALGVTDYIVKGTQSPKEIVLKIRSLLL